MTECDDSTGACYLRGDGCPGRLAAATPLATEYTVASVEHLDEPRQPAETLVAVIEKQR